jgi:hypothetical protein
VVARNGWGDDGSGFGSFFFFQRNPAPPPQPGAPMRRGGQYYYPGQPQPNYYQGQQNLYQQQTW